MQGTTNFLCSLEQYLIRPTPAAAQDVDIFTYEPMRHMGISIRLKRPVQPFGSRSDAQWVPVHEFHITNSRAFNTGFFAMQPTQSGDAPVGVNPFHDDESQNSYHHISDSSVDCRSMTLKKEPKPSPEPSIGLPQKRHTPSGIHIFR